ncbi:hypothetical protein ACVW07_002255 [Cellulomonas sp. URHB0016]
MSKRVARIILWIVAPATLVASVLTLVFAWDARPVVFGALISAGAALVLWGPTRTAP